MYNTSKSIEIFPTRSDFLGVKGTRNFPSVIQKEAALQLKYILMAAPVLIYADMMSQPARAVVWFAKLTKIPHQVVSVQIAKGQNRTPEFGKLNPFKKVPVIDDRGFKIFESHTIMRYLADEYKVADHWYPKDLKKRAIVNEYLDWHHTATRKIATYSFAKVIGPRIGQVTPRHVVEAAEKDVEYALSKLDTVWLNGRPYIAGDEISIADLSAFSEVSNIKLLKMDISSKPNLSKWMSTMEKVEGYGEAFEVFQKVLAKL